MTNRDKNILGQILAKTYRIERFLGVGTVGTVYVARHVRSGGLYAVKVLHRKLAASPDLYQRFQDEARLIATLRHPHILPITDFDRDENGIPFFVMDLLEGENLQQRLKHKEVLPIAQALEILQQAGSALQTAHRSGIIHRNIKPENIFLVRHDLGDRVTETAKVMDFGLARFRRTAPAGTRDASLGISVYMAPELLQESSTAVDGRADQWALAVIMYRMLTGKLPFDDSNQDDMQRQILSDAPRPFPKLSPELPAHTVAAILRGMAKRREDRFESTMDFVKALSSRSTTGAGIGPGSDGVAADQAAAQAVPQVRPMATSGRITAPMPPIPSGAVPPPIPSAVSSAPHSAPTGHSPPPTPHAPPPSPSPNIPAPRRPTPVPHAPPPSPPASLQPPPQTPPKPAAVVQPIAQPAVQPTRPSAVSPKAATPFLMGPPLLLPDPVAVTQAPPSSGPSRGLLISGGVIAVLAGVGLTLLWEQRQHQHPPLPPQTVVTGNPNGDPMVVEALPTPNVPAPTSAQPPDAGQPGALAPRPAPPLRPAGDEPEAVVPPAVGVAPGPAPAPPVSGQPSPNPQAVAAPVGVGSPPTPPPAAVNPSAPAWPAPSVLPAKPPGVVTTAPGSTPSAPPPTGAAPAIVPAPAAAPPTPAPSGPLSTTQRQTRDEVDELLGSGAVKAPAPAPPPAAPPAAVAPPPRPVAPRPVAPRPVAEPVDVAPPVPEAAEKILEEAQAAYVRGERQRAIELALQVTNRPNPVEAVRAWRFIGSAACSVRSASLATRAYNNLALPEHKQLLSELCKRNGLTFHDGQFSTD